VFLEVELSGHGTALYALYWRDRNMAMHPIILKVEPDGDVMWYFVVCFGETRT
jgi:hypothetical protein